MSGPFDVPEMGALAASERDCINLETEKETLYLSRALWRSAERPAYAAWLAKARKTHPDTSLHVVYKQCRGEP